MNMLKIIEKINRKKRNLNILAIAESVIEEIDKNDPEDLLDSDRENLRKYALEYHAATEVSVKKDKLDKLAAIIEIYSKGDNLPPSIRTKLKSITGF